MSNKASPLGKLPAFIKFLLVAMGIIKELLILIKKFVIIFFQKKWVRKSFFVFYVKLTFHLESMTGKMNEEQRPVLQRLANAGVYTITANLSVVINFSSQDSLHHYKV